MKDKNPKKKKKSRQKQESGPSVESLGSALNALEGILEDQHVVPGSSIPAKASTASSSDEQEAIPLLEDIVVPGQKLTDATETTTGAGDPYGSEPGHPQGQGVSGDPYETEAGTVPPEHSSSCATMHPQHTLFPEHRDSSASMHPRHTVLPEHSHSSASMHPRHTVLPEHSHSSASMHPRHTVLPVHNDLTLRLVNELEIIIEDSVAETLSQAKRELITKVKNHLDIVLPEILAELERRREEE
ncbi:MAG: hypothetical protein GY731_02570 [Gammaproteobacteria bacterium]|nr:hypothetical protein [Gammaproteobacteria bacterium]